jgi:nicotinate-nucleotide adenylyltransferase
MIIPAGHPWMREHQPQASGNDRLAMCEAALTDLSHDLQDRTMVLDIEVRREGPTYTIETLNSLGAFFPRDEFTLLLGSDAAAGINKWSRAEDVKRQAKILVIKRQGQKSSESSEFKEIEIKAPDISSTQIRAALAAGGDVDQLLSPSVLRYIREKHLYGSK